MHLRIWYEVVMAESRYNLGIFLEVLNRSVAQWLRHCATNWKVTGLIPDGVTGIFH
jgi:hypothetical protein